ncbi:hypothetical protein [Guptibacillus hwajinpoensis]|uniref:hypothetical protein n=1 Tax=Guptibacillus hwajinpoensis TaxID=208199 RepID=UPI0024B32047|nr:hypothetical protein [Pseudalkalibacillus hwajinpoensis]
MRLLTSKKVAEFELIQQALINEGLPKLSDDARIKRLGEGAWHCAYLIEREGLVLRIPKKIAYEREVIFNRKELIAEYAATKAFYAHANKAKNDICPNYFKYSVNEELTYTLETYVGKSIDLSTQTIEDSKRYGRELGEVYLALESFTPPFKGIGYLYLDEKEELTGAYNLTVSEFLLEETEEYCEELHTLIASPYQFDKEKVKENGGAFISNRSIDRESIILTNQDASPENLIFTKSGVKMIDPYPLLATGTSLAANYVFNYETLFPTFYNTERYRKGNYHQHVSKLIANAEGFREGYISHMEQKHEALHVEVFLKLLTMAHDHFLLLQKESLTREEVIRYGTKGQVEERFMVYLKELEKYPYL